VYIKCLAGPTSHTVSISSSKRPGRPPPRARHIGTRSQVTEPPPTPSALVAAPKEVLPGPDEILRMLSAPSAVSDAGRFKCELLLSCQRLRGPQWQVLMPGDSITQIMRDVFEKGEVDSDMQDTISLALGL
jgi:hypothetical protein